MDEYDQGRYQEQQTRPAAGRRRRQEQTSSEQVGIRPGEGYQYTQYSRDNVPYTASSAAPLHYTQQTDPGSQVAVQQQFVAPMVGDQRMHAQTQAARNYAQSHQSYSQQSYQQQQQVGPLYQIQQQNMHMSLNTSSITQPQFMSPQQYFPHQRHPLERPVVKLSLNLIDTYKKINEGYFEERKQRKEAQSSQRREQGSQKVTGVYNNGWDDEHYDYILTTGEVIFDRYEIKERIGKGSFGQVIQAYDRQMMRDVAIKIIKSKRPFQRQARTEIELLTHLKENDRDDQNNIVRLQSHFMYRNHQCLVFEMLSLNLYELLKNTQFSGVSLNLIRKFAKQILKALQYLSRPDVDVIHCDLKPENILLRHPKRSGIKVIDFGSSCLSNKQMYQYIQSRFYRSPEVILQLPYSVAIDMWSLGCILVEMHTGEPLFSGSDQFDQMQKIVKILGMIPDDILMSMKEEERNKYFEIDTNGEWTIKQKEGQPIVVPSMNPIESLKELFRRRNASTEASQPAGNYDVFVDLVYRMLAFRPSERIKPHQALQHQFIVADRKSVV